MGEHKLHVYTGDGKGKTTAAMGLALRSLGHGRRVLIAQFLKDGRSGELTALSALPGAAVFEAEPIEGFVFQMTPEAYARAQQTQRAQAQALCERIRRDAPDLIVLDELSVALHVGMIDEAAARELIGAALCAGETVVTGRNAPDWLCEMADYVSVIRAQKHPFDAQGLPAREGVEW
ncbi:MAG: cob(I)yrinic acid a,c-diamide adenosyltransferase [Clostridia bacterium]|nr:cob(I)yrinic acid a,c-diamide adenosyltransferase [Clostridia bacterium]